MKRFTCTILFVLYTCCIFAQEIKYKAKIDTIVSKTAYTYRSEELFEQKFCIDWVSTMHIWKSANIL